MQFIWYKLNWAKRANAVYWLLGTLLYPRDGPLTSMVFQQFSQPQVQWSTMVLAVKDLKKCKITTYPILWQITLVIDNKIKKISGSFQSLLDWGSEFYLDWRWPPSPPPFLDIFPKFTTKICNFFGSKITPPPLSNFFQKNIQIWVGGRPLYGKAKWGL